VPTPSHQRTLWILATLTLATVLAYLPIWNAQFLTVDDHAYVSENTVVQQGLTANSVIDGRH